MEYEHEMLHSKSLEIFINQETQSSGDNTWEEDTTDYIVQPSIRAFYKGLKPMVQSNNIPKGEYTNSFQIIKSCVPTVSYFHIFTKST